MCELHPLTQDFVEGRKAEAEGRPPPSTKASSPHPNSSIVINGLGGER
jgi:hypothetical protein